MPESSDSAQWAYEHGGGARRSLSGEGTGMSGVEELAEQLAVAVKALRRYGGHDMRCTKVTDDYAEMQPPRCSCGYDAILHRLGGGSR